MKIVCCDLCGKEEEQRKGDKERNDIANGRIVVFEHGLYSEPIEVDYFDICGECLDILKADCVGLLKESIMRRKTGALPPIAPITAEALAEDDERREREAETEVDLQLSSELAKFRAHCKKFGMLSVSSIIAKAQKFGILQKRLAAMVELSESDISRAKATTTPPPYIRQAFARYFDVAE